MEINFKGTNEFPKYEGGDNYSIDMIFENEAVISIDRRSRYSDKCVMSREEMEANAVLICTSVEMFKMLKRVSLGEFPEDEIKALLKKATDLS